MGTRIRLNRSAVAAHLTLRKQTACIFYVFLEFLPCRGIKKEAITLLRMRIEGPKSPTSVRACTFMRFGRLYVTDSSHSCTYWEPPSLVTL